MKPLPESSERHEIPVASWTLQRKPATARIRLNGSTGGSVTDGAGSAANCGSPLRSTRIVVGAAVSPSGAGTSSGAPVMPSAVAEPPALPHPARVRGTITHSQRPLGVVKA